MNAVEEELPCPECSSPLEHSKVGLCLTTTCPICGFSCSTTDQNDPFWGKTRHRIFCPGRTSSAAIAKVAVLLGVRALDLRKTIAEGRPAAFDVPTLEARELVARLRAFGVDARAEPPLDDEATGPAS